MTIEEMKAYIAEELKEEYRKLLSGEPNHYSYLFMIANDMGLTAKSRPDTMTQEQLVKHAYNGALATWSAEWDRLKQDPGNHITQYREQKAWNELSEISALLKQFEDADA